MKAINKNNISVTKHTKSIIVSAICWLLMTSNANAEFNLYLQNKLGDDREIVSLFSEITTDTGNLFGNPGMLATPILPKKLLKLGNKLTTSTLDILYLMAIEYQCVSNPGSQDCWSYDPDFLSLPNGPLYCDFNQNFVIDTADKVVSGSGTTGQATYETRQVRLILNKDFTVTYRVIRKNLSTGSYSRSEENITVVNGGSACNLNI